MSTQKRHHDAKPCHKHFHVADPVPQHHFPRDGDREDAIFAMIPPRKLKISPRRGSWTGNGALEAVDGVQGRLTAPWRRQRPATHVACPAWDWRLPAAQGAQLFWPARS